MSLEPLTEALKRLTSGTRHPEDLRELQQALDSGQVDIDTASGGGVIIKGNVSGGTVSTITNKFVLPREVLKFLQQPVYRPAALPLPGELADRGTLPPGSRLTFSPNAVFTGRQEDLIELARDLLYTHYKSGVVVSGMGGMGKSQLAVEFCYRYGRFFRGVHWIQANLDIQAEIAENGLAMGLPYWPDKLPEQVQVTLRASQESGPRLIVLDNAEDLQVLQDWLSKLRPARMLITSRRENWPMDMGLKVKKLQVLARRQSIELLRKLAARLKDMPDELLDNLADFLGDLPLAIDLAGRYMADRPELSIEGYLAELKEAGSAMEHTSLRDWVEHSPTRHLTNLAATFALSWERLTKDDELAKRLFRMGGYCAPNIPIPRQLMVKAMGADVPDHEVDRALRKLDSLGLMDSSESGRRMHSLLAEFARLQDRESDESVLPGLAEAMVGITTKALESGLLENMKPLREHLEAVAKVAEKSELQISGALLNNLGMNLQNLADYEGAKRFFERALKIDEKAYGPDHPKVARDVNNIGMVLRDLGDLHEAMKYLERALKIDERIYGPDQPDLATISNNIGLVLQDLGKLEEARKYLERALRIDENVYGPDDPKVAIDVNNIGGVLKDLGDLHGAMKYFERALKINENAFGPDHSNVATIANNIGMVLRDLGDLQKACEYLERALKIDEKAYGPDHPSVAIDANNTGLVLQDLGKLEEARKCYERALRIDENVYGPDHPKVAKDANNIGAVLQDLGDLHGAMEYLERALKINERMYGPDHPNVATTTNNIGIVLQALGNLQDARKCYERALKIFRDKFGPDHPNTRFVTDNLNSLSQG